VAPVETPQESQPVAEAEEPSEVVAVQPKLSAEARVSFLGNIVTGYYMWVLLAQGNLCAPTQ